MKKFIVSVLLLLNFSAYAGHENEIYNPQEQAIKNKDFLNKSNSFCNFHWHLFAKGYFTGEIGHSVDSVEKKNGILKINSKFQTTSMAKILSKNSEVERSIIFSIPSKQIIKRIETRNGRTVSTWQKQEQKFSIEHIQSKFEKKDLEFQLPVIDSTSFIYLGLTNLNLNGDIQVINKDTHYKAKIQTTLHNIYFSTEKTFGQANLHSNIPFKWSYDNNTLLVEAKLHNIDCLNSNNE